MRRSLALTAATALLALAGCSSSAKPAPAPSTPSTSAPASDTPTMPPPSTSASSSATPTSPGGGPTPTAPSSTLAAGVTLSGQARTLSPGPFTIKAVSCGPYTAAQQAQFGTNATAGLVFKYTNVSNSVTGAPVLSVDFVQGANVLGNNVNGDPAPVGPGQSAEAAVDALDKSGDNLAKFTCQLMAYGLASDPSVSYAP